MVLKKYALLVLLFAVTLCACGQQKGKNEKIDVKNSSTKIFQEPETITIYRLQEKVELQALELNVYKNLHAKDTIHYGNDSVIVFFKGQDGIILKKIKKFVWKISGREDSIVSYFNNKGLLTYYELWQDGYRKIDSLIKDTVWVKTKLTFSRYKYDNQDRLIWRYKLLGDSIFGEDTITYNANGKPTRHTKRIAGGSPILWGSFKETLEK